MKGLFKPLFLALLFVAGSALAGEINVNTADAATLAAELDGVGQARAEAIVAYRERHGDFETLEDLLKVKGIGKAIIEKNAENIRFSDEGAEGE